MTHTRLVRISGPVLAAVLGVWLLLCSLQGALAAHSPAALPAPARAAAASARPVITDVQPAAFSNSVSTTLAITAAGLFPTTSVRIGRATLDEITLVDSDTLTVHVPAGLPPLAYTALLYDDVEREDVTRTWQAGVPWTRAANSAHSGYFSWEADWASAGSAALALSGTLDLSTLPDPVLDFWHQLDLEDGDAACVEISSGAAWMPLVTFRADQPLWQHGQLDLRPFASYNAVRIRFRLFNQYAGGNNALWRLDDIALTSAAGGLALSNPGQPGYTDVWLGSLSITNRPAQLEIELQRDEQVAGLPFLVSLAARDAWGYLAQAYTGSLTMTITGITPTRVSGFTAGQLAIVTQVAGIQDYVVISITDGAITATSTPFDVVDQERAAYLHLEQELDRYQQFWVYSDGGASANHYAITYTGAFTDVRLDAWHTATVHSGATAIRASYTASDTTGFCQAGAAWLDPPGNWSGESGGFYLDGATELVFWARGEHGGERITFGLGGVRAPGRGVPLTLSRQWQRYTIPLNGLDLERVVEGFYWTAGCGDNPNGATFYLDDIHYLYQSNRLLYVYQDRFSPLNFYVPSGWVGDLDQVGIDEGVPDPAYPGATATRFTYDSLPGAYDRAGVYYLWPAGNWGIDPAGGHRLSGATRVMFRARGAWGGEQVTFGLGGVTGTYGDSTGAHEFSVYLGTDWQEYSIDLPGANLERVVGGFYWTAERGWNPGGLTFYVDDVRYEFEQASWLRLMPGYVADASQPADAGLAGAAHVYDNALAILAFLARGEEGDMERARAIADALLYVQEHDPDFDDGRLRNVYHAESLGDSGATGWAWADAYGAGSHTGSLAWAALALARTYQATGDSRYLTAAIRLGDWMQAHTTDARFYGGYTGGYNGDAVRSDWKSTWHNLAAYAAFATLYDITNNTTWWAHALHAKRFVRALWHAGTLADGQSVGWFWAGTRGNWLVYGDGEQAVSFSQPCQPTPTLAYPHNHYHLTPFGPAAGSVQFDAYYTPTVHSGQTSLRLIVPASAPAWAGLIGLEGEGNWGTAGPGYDMTDARSLTVWLRGAHGGERATLGIGGVPYTTTALPISTSLPGTYASVLTQSVSLTTTWQLYTISLPASHTLDLAHHIGGFFVYVEPTHTLTQSEILIDDIVYHLDGPSGEALDDELLALNASTLGLLALGEQPRYGKTADWIYAALWVSETIPGGSVSGFDFDADRDGLWLEGSGQAALAFQVDERQAWHTASLSDAVHVQENAPHANRQGLVAALHDCLTTGPGQYDYNRLRIAPTAWFIFAQQAYNPVWGLPISSPIPFQGPLIQSVFYYADHLLLNGHSFDAWAASLQLPGGESVPLTITASSAITAEAALLAPLAGGVTYTASLTNTDGQSDRLAFSLFPALDVSKQASPAVVQAGQQVIYTIRLTNTGNVELNASVVDTLPAQGTPAGLYTWEAQLAPGAAWTQPVAITVKMGYSGTLTNVISVSTLEGPSRAYTETSLAQVTPSLAVSKLAWPEPVISGYSLTYTIYVANTGNVSLTATVTDVLPDHLSPAGQSGRTLTWTPLSIPPGQAWMQTLVVTPQAGYSGTLANLVRVSTLEGASGSYTATSNVRNEARLEVSKHAHTSTVMAGQPLTYTIRVANTGSLLLHATLTDFLPSHILPGSTAGGTAILPGGELVWPLVTISPRQAWTQRIVVTPEMGYNGTLTNVVQAVTLEGPARLYTETTLVTYQAFVYLPLALKNWPLIGAPMTLYSHRRYTDTHNFLSAALSDGSQTYADIDDTNEWPMTLEQDLAGTRYGYSIFASSPPGGGGSCDVEIVLRRGSLDSVLASWPAAFTVPDSEQAALYAATSSKGDPQVQPGDKLILRIHPHGGPIRIWMGEMLGNGGYSQILVPGYAPAAWGLREGRRPAR